MGNLNDFNTEQKNDFLKAEYKEPIKIGDILIFKGDTFHRGVKIYPMKQDILFIFG